MIIKHWIFPNIPLWNIVEYYIIIKGWIHEKNVTILIVNSQNGASKYKKTGQDKETNP